jgi:CHASE2 domain-containing sensor protein
MNENSGDEKTVVVTDVRMPFGSMVVFLIKWALASIPALLILWFIFAILMALFMTLFGGFAGYHSMYRQMVP